MTDITNDTVTRFLNEILRPISQSVRNVNAEGREAGLEFNVIVPFLADDTALIQDGRVNDGSTKLSVAEVKQIMTILGELKVVLAKEGYMQVIAKACVAPLRVSS